MRIPRIKNLTVLSIKYYASKEEEHYYDLLLHVVSHYIQKGSTYLGIPLSLSEICNMLSIKITTFQDLVLKVPTLFGSAFSSKDLEVQAELRARAFSEIMGSLTADTASISALKTLIMNELQYPNSSKINIKSAYLLLKTVEVNSKLQGTLITMLEKHFTPQQVTNILQISANPAGEKGYLTQEMALKMLGDLASEAATSPNFMAGLAEKYAIHDSDVVPEVRVSGALNPDGRALKPRKSDASLDADSSIIYSIEDV